MRECSRKSMILNLFHLEESTMKKLGFLAVLCYPAELRHVRRLPEG